MNANTGYALLNRQHKWIPSVLFAVGIAATLFHGPFLWIARTGWVLVAISFAVNRYNILRAISFYAAFFFPTGFLEHEIFFSLKHFQIAVLVGIAAHMVRGGLPLAFEQGWKASRRIFWPLFLIFGIGLLNYALSPLDLRAFRTPLNALCSLFAVIYISGLALTPGQNADLKFGRRSINFFIAGCMVQVLLAFFNHWSGQKVFDLMLLHNNHLGVLCSLAIFFSLAQLIAAKNIWRPVYFISSLVIFSGMTFSFSRTSWISFMAGLIVFMVFLAKHRRRFKNPHIFRGVVIPSMILFAGFVCFSASRNPMLFSRITILSQLVDPEYWKFMLSDKQNFGCFGIYRLQMFNALIEIMSTHPFLGVGFIRRVVDFHGFLWTVLGGTGLAGFSVLIFFFARLLNDLYRSIAAEIRFEIFCVKLGIFSSVLVWLLVSTMESYFVQFAPWYVMIAAIFFLKNPDLK